MDGAIVIAALILNPIARRKRAAEVAEPVRVATSSTSDPGGSSSAEKSDLESGGSPVADENPAQTRGSHHNVVT